LEALKEREERERQQKQKELEDRKQKEQDWQQRREQAKKEEEERERLRKQKEIEDQNRRELELQQQRQRQRFGTEDKKTAAPVSVHTENSFSCIIHSLTEESLFRIKKTKRKNNEKEENVNWLNFNDTKKKSERNKSSGSNKLEQSVTEIKKKPLLCVLHYVLLVVLHFFVY
jgi:hypothetical protein